MPQSILKRRHADDNPRAKPAKRPKKFKKQREYHSSSEDEDEAPQNGSTDFKPVSLDDSDDDAGPAEDVDSGVRLDMSTSSKLKKAANEAAPEEGSSQSSASDDDDADSTAFTSASDSESFVSADSDASTSGTAAGKKPRSKRHDPSAFATSMNKILSSKLTSAKRADPVLARSRDAHKTSQTMAEEKLEARARHKLRDEKRAAKEKGRVKDVNGGEQGDEHGVSAAQVAEEERKLRKIAQRGVIKLFNAVRAAQMRGSEAAKDVRKEGMLGVEKREDAVREKSRQEFLAAMGKGEKKKA
ncbi:Rrp15p-domain-containing protein, partial [Lineolata rhizophorae]